MENKKEDFSYTYSNEKVQEIQKIREKYLDKEKEKSNLEKIKELDASTTKTGTIVSLILGIASSLVMGTGMCCAMLWNMMAIGIVVGTIGIVGMCFTYPVYKSLVKSSREKVKTEILSLCEQEIK